MDLNSSTNIGNANKNLVKKDKGFSVFKGTCVPPYYHYFAEEIENFEVRDDDIWICSFPKAGTTWCQELVWCISNDLDYEGAKRSLMERFPFLEYYSIHSVADPSGENFDFYPPFIYNSVNYVKNMPSPRFIKTHLPYELLPRKLRTGEKKPTIIYPYRNPKDVCISLYHFLSFQSKFHGTLDEWYEHFLEDKVLYAPFWDHILGYWRRRHEFDNFMVVRYEDMKTDLPSIVQKMCKFLGKAELANEEMETLTKHLSFENMKHNRAVNMEDYVEIVEKVSGIPRNMGCLIRSGKKDQWKKEMPLEIVSRFDKWIDENLKNSDFLV